MRKLSKISLLAVLGCSLLLPSSFQWNQSNTANAAEKPLVSFPVLSDIHMLQNDYVSEQKFTNALNDLNKINPKSDALILNGDLTITGRNEDYDLMNKVLKAAPHPKNVFYTIGNHEFYKAWFDPKTGINNPDGFPNGETEKMSIDRYLKKTGTKKLYYDQWINDYHFIFLGSEKYRQSDPTNGEDAFLSQTQLDWLKTKLKEKASANKPIFLFLHQPIGFTVAGTDMSAPENARAVIQYKQLTEILAKYPQVINFSGHTHWSLGLPNQTVQYEFTMANSGSVRDPYNDKDQPLGGAQSDGLYVQAYKNKVVIKARDFNQHKWYKQVYTINFPYKGKKNPNQPKEPEALSCAEPVKADLIDYRFEKSATEDSSASKNNGIEAGTPTVQYDPAFGKNVLVLDGKSYVRIKDNAGLRPDALTLTAQYSLNSLEGVQDIVAKNQGSDYGFEFNPDTKQVEAWFYIKGDTESKYLIAKTPPIKANTVYTTVATYDGKELVMYQDGVKVDAQAFKGKISNSGVIVDLAIGVDPEPDDAVRSYAAGKIGLVQVYGKALSKEQVGCLQQQLKNQVTADLVDYRFDVSAIEDSSPAKNNGIAVGNPTVQFDEAFGKKVLVLDGKSYVRIKDNAALRPDKLTLAAQFSLDKLDSVQDPVAKNQSSDYGLEFNPATQKLEAWFYVKGDTEAKYVITTTPELKAKTVYTVVVTYDGNELVMYLNGAKVDSKPMKGKISTGGDIVDLTIGVDPEPNDTARSNMTGKVGFVKVYSKALNKDQVAALFAGLKK
ncbi:LamG-like jellyroll fold domain-containing protein [Cohnella yongneupensis]|uniref:LamG-like jellyroll fold domain-containing protein n=1 Tax=Cohnella yongneupensis TaxID=425006 RepID=A0ABW0QUG5_9BACL